MPFRRRISNQLERIERKIDKMDVAIEALSAKLNEYFAAVNAALADQAAAIRKAVDEAIAADDAQEAVDLNAMKGKIEDELAKLPPAPPVFDPSANNVWCKPRRRASA